MKATKNQAEQIFNNFYDAMDAVLAPIYSMNMDLFEPGQKSDEWEYELTITNLLNDDFVRFQFNLDKNIAMMAYRKGETFDGSIIHNPLSMKDVSVLCKNLPV